MKYENALTLVAQEFGKTGIPFVLIGGFAVSYHKVIKAVPVVEALVTVESAEKATQVLEMEGYQLAKSGKPFRQFRNPDHRFMAVDLVLVDRETFGGIVEEAVEAKIAEEKCLLPSLNHLIALKLHAIQSDPRLRELTGLSDVIGLIKANKVDTKSEKFRELCLDYGTKELYEKIVSHVSS